MAEQRVQRRLAAILAADVAGYSRLMGEDEEGTLAALNAHLDELVRPCIAEHRGRVVKTTGDGLLAEFASVVDAVRCAIVFQQGMSERGDGPPGDRQIEFRIGVNLGDVIVQDDDVYGDGVNVAARLEGLAEPGGICISGTVYDHVVGKIDAGFDDLGPRTVKNIAGPIRVLRVRGVTNDPTNQLTDVSAPVPGFHGRPAIAVLPLQNLSGDPEQEYFADGIAEDILTRLAMWRWCPIIARNSSFAFKGQSMDVRQIGRVLGARYVFEGSVRKAGQNVRITAQLIDAETGHHVWANRYDRSLDDIFAVQDEITDAIVSALEPIVGNAEIQRARMKPPANLDAWDLFQRGMWHFARLLKDDFASACTLFEGAIDKDPNFAGSHSMLAITMAVEVLFGWTDDPQRSLQDSHEQARVAISLDPMDAAAQTALSTCTMFLRQYDNSLAAGLRSVELNPSSAIGQYTCGMAHLLTGRPKEAILYIEQAIRLSANDPQMPPWLSGLAFCYYLQKDYEKSLEITTLAVQMAPHYTLAQRNHACALAQLGRTEEARAALERFLALSPGYSMEAARRSAPFRDDANFEHLVDGLRKAGWGG